MTDIGRLEDAAREAIGSISATYKRTAIWEYINALKTTIARQEREINDLGDQLVKNSTKPAIKYGCDLCKCDEYDGFQGPLGWTRCSCGHIAQDHNREMNT